MKFYKIDQIRGESLNGHLDVYKVGLTMQKINQIFYKTAMYCDSFIHYQQNLTLTMWGLAIQILFFIFICLGPNPLVDCTSLDLSLLYFYQCSLWPTPVAINLYGKTSFYWRRW